VGKRGMEEEATAATDDDGARYQRMRAGGRPAHSHYARAGRREKKRTAEAASCEARRRGARR